MDTFIYYLQGLIMISVKNPVLIISTFVWIGFVCSISFMEAWLKFQAPGITLSLGLGIGRLVFNALNKIEWVFAIAIFIQLIFEGKQALPTRNITYAIALLLLIVQSLWLLPALDARAEMHIQNQSIEPSNIHFYYVGLEFIKVIALSIYGKIQFRKTN